MTKVSFCFWLDGDTHEWSMSPIGDFGPIAVTARAAGASLIFESLACTELEQPRISAEGVPRLCSSCLAAVCAATWDAVRNARLLAVPSLDQETRQ